MIAIKSVWDKAGNEIKKLLDVKMKKTMDKLHELKIQDSFSAVGSVPDSIKDTFYSATRRRIVITKGGQRGIIVKIIVTQLGIEVHQERVTRTVNKVGQDEIGLKMRCSLIQR